MRTIEEWRTIQLFVASDGVAEVELETFNQKKVRCSCGTYASRKKCKHTKFVRKSMSKSSDGVTYSISVPEDVDDDEAMAAISDPKAFREFVIKHGKVIHLD